MLKPEDFAALNNVYFEGRLPANVLEAIVYQIDDILDGVYGCKVLCSYLAALADVDYITVDEADDLVSDLEMFVDVENFMYDIGCRDTCRRALERMEA